MVRLPALLLGTLLVLNSSLLHAQASFDYTQNFNGMSSSATTPPAGWSVKNGASGTTNTTWATSVSTSGVAAMVNASGALSASNTPTANQNNGYNAGAPGDSANRLLASAPTTNAGTAFHLQLTNSTTEPFTQIKVAYDIRRFTSTSTTNELPGYWLFYSLNGTTWANVSALNPVVSGSAPAVVVPNSVGVTSVPATTITLTSAWAAGAVLHLRWVDDNALETSPDQVFGLDNVSISATNRVNALPTVAITAPAPASVIDAPATIQITATAADSDGTVTKVEFFSGTTKLGEDTSSPYELTWNSVLSGNYALTAKATDNDGVVVTSEVVNIQVTNEDNVAPTALITSPVAGKIPARALTITADASDSDGAITKVEFFRDTTKLGEDSTAPYTFDWSSFPVGNYSLTVRVTDNDGAVTTSSPVLVEAVAFTDVTRISRGSVWKYLDNGTDQGTAWKETTFDDTSWASGSAELGYADSPVTVLRQGPSGQTSSTKYIAYYFRRTFNVPEGATVLGLKINLLRDDGAVIYLNGVEVGRSNMPTGPVNYLTESQEIVSNDDENTYFPIDLPFAAIVPGDNVIAVSLHQRDNTSSDLSFDMDLLTSVEGGNALPHVTLTSPAAGSTYFTGATVNLAAEADDSDGTVSKIEFYQGNTKIGEDPTAPYEFVWNNVTAATYNLTAVATDNEGGSATSSAVSITVSPGPSGTLSRGPYLNQSNENSIVIRWRSSQSVIGRVRYGLSPDALTLTEEETATATDHVVKLSGLTPYTRYYYAVGSTQGDLLSAGTDHTFRTSPVPGTATDTRIWVVGDCGRGNQFQRDVRDAYYSWTGSRIPDLCLMLGDNAYNSGTDTEYQTGFYNIYPTYFRRMPLWSTLGNHDANNGSTSSSANFPYFDMFTFPTAGECGGVASGTERYHSFDYGNIHFINLDSQTSSRNTIERNGSDGPMAAWLRNDLASTTKTWIIAFFHHPPYSKGSHDSDSESQMVQMRTNFGPILEQGGVDLVLVGHSHAYERSILVDSHYGVSSTLTPAMKKNAGSGRPSGTGAYIKPLTGPRDHFGAVYTVTGSAGSADGGSLNHAVMYVSYNTGGTFNIDINGSRLDATYIQKGATTGTFTTPDSFTIIKQGAADSDGDGISDEYEIAAGLDRFSAADASLDSDKDGISNLDEYLFGLQSNVSDRYAWTTTKEPSTGNYTVCYPTLSGRTYQVFYSTDLVTWNLASDSVAGDGTVKCWTDDGTGATQTASNVAARRFYKVKVTLVP